VLSSSDAGLADLKCVLFNEACVGRFKEHSHFPMLFLKLVDVLG
jgi:hypothetical protein